MKSLRTRIRWWIVASTTITVGLVTTFGVMEDRRQIERAEVAYLTGFLEHLSAMPEFRGDSGTVRSHLRMLVPSFERAGGRLDLVPLSSASQAPSGSGIVACHELDLSDGRWTLHYWSDGRFVRARFRSALAIQLLQAALTIAGLIAGIEWILRRSLLGPLGTISRQIERISEGGGWLASVPATDLEFDRLTTALRALGPGLEQQTRQWIAAERRCAVAAALSGIRERTLGPLRSAHLELSQLEAGSARDAETKRRLRRAARSIEELSAALAESDAQWFPPSVGEGQAARREGRRSA
ncbi:MAG: hypothetical protein IT186_03480 [Acidobacteria bacterium]|nr:hypothetical protein [Acidobacteriota bacterium]